VIAPHFVIVFVDRFPKTVKGEKASESRGRNLNAVLRTCLQRYTLSHVREAADTWYWNSRALPNYVTELIYC